MLDVVVRSEAHFAESFGWRDESRLRRPGTLWRRMWDAEPNVTTAWKTLASTNPQWFDEYFGQIFRRQGMESSSYRRLSGLLQS